MIMNVLKWKLATNGRPGRVGIPGMSFARLHYHIPNKTFISCQVISICLLFIKIISVIRDGHVNGELYEMFSFCISYWTGSKSPDGYSYRQPKV